MTTPAHPEPRADIHGCVWTWHGLRCALLSPHRSPHHIVGEQPAFAKIEAAIEAEAQRAPGDGGLVEAVLRTRTTGSWMGGDKPDRVVTHREVRHWESLPCDTCKALSAIPPAPPSAGVWVTAEGLAAALRDAEDASLNPSRMWHRTGNPRGAAADILRALGPSAQEGASE